MTFMDDYWAGKTDGGDIDDYTRAFFHDKTLPADASMAEYLGMTPEQWRTWFEDDTLPERGAP